LAIKFNVRYFYFKLERLTMLGNRFSLILTLLVGATTPSLAQKSYFGALHDSTNFDGTEKILSAYDISEFTGFKIDDEANGFTLVYGRPIKNNASLELTYAETGELGISAPVGATYTRPEKGTKTVTTHSELNAEAIVIGAAVLVPVFSTELVSSFVRVGLDYYESEITAIYGAIEYGGLKYGKQKGLAPSFAAGVDIKVSKDISLRAQYKLYGFDVMDDYKLDTLSFGLLGRF
jgi:hypothetical protein